MSKRKTTLLAIETSCDETAAAVLIGNVQSKVPDFSTISSVVHSQIPLHKKMGGVVPEVAARAHITHIRPVVEEALTRAKVKPIDLTHIAVTTGPGLIGSLLVGTEFAKGLAYSLHLPLLPINHMEGHLFSPFSEAVFNFPALALIVSGGHTLLVLQKNERQYRVLGSTVDDAAGEAFDKVARLLGLPYPGGPEISKLALKGKNAIPFPRPMLHSKDYDFSFAGLKTAVRYFLAEQKKITSQLKADIAASFQMAVVDVLVTKAIKAAKEYKCKTISLSGGVAANKALRADLEKACKEKGITFIVPEFDLCTDNAGMIAIAAYYKLRNGAKQKNPSLVKADPGWELK
jgi:N6-L-threonylcarbamoyladenine synthase